MAKPNPPTGVQVFNPETLEDLDIVWDVVTDPQAMIIGFNIYRSVAPVEDQATTFVKINQELVLITTIRDTDIRLRLNRKFWYVVTAVNLDGESNFSVAATHEWAAQGGSMNNILKEIQRRKRIMLNDEKQDHPLFQRNFDAGLVGEKNDTQSRGRGESVKLFIKIVAGQRCELCFNVAKRQAEETCPNCFGTSYEDGYVRFGKMQMSISQGPEVLAMTETGLIQDENPTGWIANFPIVKSGDVIRRQDGKMVELNSVDRKTFAQGIITEQTMKLKELPTTLSIYKIDDAVAPPAYYGSG